MKTLQLLSVLALASFMLISCSKESNCEANNLGEVVIHNNATKSKLWLTVDQSFGPGLSSADYQISAGDSVRFDLPAGIHTIEGVYTTPLPGNGTQQSSVADKEFVLDQCAEVNIYYDL